MKDSVAAELAIKAQQGDMQAFEQLYTEYSPLIYSILLEITHDTYEAEDLTQDCFASALKNIQSLKEPSKIKKWLTAIAANHGKDYLKKKKPALLGAEHEYIFDIQEEKNEDLLPEENAILDERDEEIREIVNSVSEDKRLCLILFYQHEMSITEISEELGISESAVKSRLFRAREDIREEVEKRNKKGMPLFGIAPLPLILFALQKSSQAAASSFAGSAAQTAVFAGITSASQAGIAAASTAATTAASATASAAGTTASAATGIGAKVAAMSVAQKVVAGVAAASIATGSAAVTTVVVKNKIDAREETTTAYVEEVTTAPDYGFENETVFIPAVAETESGTSATSTSRNSTSVSQPSTDSQTKGEEKSTSAPSTTKTESTTKKPTTTKATTTKKETTTQKVTTTKATTTEEETTAKVTTTKAVTTTRAATTTTTKATTTTTTTTKSASPATVTVTLYTSGSEVTTQKTLSFDIGESITDSVIEERLMSDYGIDAMSDSISETAELGGSYSVDAYIIS